MPRYGFGGPRRTVAAALGLRGLPVHGPLHGFLPPGEAELALWQDDVTGQD